MEVAFLRVIYRTDVFRTGNPVTFWQFLFEFEWLSLLGTGNLGGENR